MKQVWDQVKVIGEGSYAGEAGTVQAINAKEELCQVKLDTQAEATWFKDAELQFLGR